MRPEAFRASASLLWLLAAPVAAAEPAEPGGASPGLEVLDYLGEWTGTNDEWVDPVGIYRSGLFETLPDEERKEAEAKRQEKPW